MNQKLFMSLLADVTWGYCATLSFECLNDGTDRGACGVDEIFVDSSRCHHFFNGSDQN